MKKGILLVAVFAMGIFASVALAAGPWYKHVVTSTTTTTACTDVGRGHGDFSDPNCHDRSQSDNAKYSLVTTTVTNTSTVCNTTAAGASSGPYSDAECTTLVGSTVGAPPPPPPAKPVFVQVDNMFLCYSKFETDGGQVFTIKQAITLLAAGWWLPNAVPGNVVGGDNIGKYHLVCNAPGTLTGTFLGNDQNGAEIVSAAQAAAATAAGSPEYYPIVSG